MVVVNALLPRPQLYIQAITLQAYANLRETGRILIKDTPPKCVPEGAVPFCFSTDYLMQSPAPSPRADPCQQDGIPSPFPNPTGLCWAPQLSCPAPWHPPASSSQQTQQHQPAALPITSVLPLLPRGTNLY